MEQEGNHNLYRQDCIWKNDFKRPLPVQHYLLLKNNFIGITNLIGEVFFWDFYLFLLKAIAIPLESHLILCQLFQDEQKQLIVVFPEG